MRVLGLNVSAGVSVCLCAVCVFEAHDACLVALATQGAYIMVLYTRAFQGQRTLRPARLESAARCFSASSWIASVLSCAHVFVCVLCVLCVHVQEYVQVIELKLL